MFYIYNIHDDWEQLELSTKEGWECCGISQAQAILHRVDGGAATEHPYQFFDARC